MKIITDEVTHGKKSITRVVLMTHKKTKLKIAIKSDVTDDKCTATLYAYNTLDNSWHSLHSISPMNMTTPTNMIKHDKFNDDDKNVNSAMQTDIAKLTEIAKHLL